MKDIESVIEKACIDYCEQVDSVYNEKDVFQAGAHFALSKLQHANRWRKVSEELPEETGWNKAPYLVKTKYEIQVVGYTEKRWHLKGGLCIKPNMVTEWKPIE